MMEYATTLKYDFNYCSKGAIVSVCFPDALVSLHKDLSVSDHRDL
jgi:hypothetical protein